MAAGSTGSASPGGAEPVGQAPPSPRRGSWPARLAYRLLARCHRWAESGWGGPAVGGWGALQGSVLPGPTDAVYLPLALADPGAVVRLALWAIAGASVGGAIAFGIGAGAYDQLGRPMLELIGVSDRMLTGSRATFEHHGWLLVLASTVSPLPSKATCLAAGAFGVPLWQFLPALVAGRVIRFGGIGLVVRFAGPRLLDALARRAGVPPSTTTVRGGEASDRGA